MIVAQDPPRAIDRPPQTTPLLDENERESRTVVIHDDGSLVPHVDEAGPEGLPPPFSDASVTQVVEPPRAVIARQDDGCVPQVGAGEPVEPPPPYASVESA